MFNFKSKPGTKFHFPTALGLLILLVGVGVGIFLIKTRASGTVTTTDQNANPNQVKITNVTDSSLTVSWVTAKPATGNVKFGTETNNIKQKAMDDRDQLSGEAGSFDTHHVTLKSLAPKTKYYFKIESGGKQFDNQGKPFEASTGPSLGAAPAADPIYGTILTPSGVGAENTIVYVNLANGSALSALSKTNGNWALSLATARSMDLNSYLSYDTQATIINILVQGGKQGTSSVVTITANDSPVPEITLGKSHDFRNTATETTPGTATGSAIANKNQSAFEAAINVATTSAEASGSGEITLENPSYNGEIINATQPAFIGSGPPGKVLAIKVNSENTYTGSAVVDEDGNWEFTPPAGLEPGEHSVTISYINSVGEEETLTRSFVIAAAGDTEIPAIVATPSGTVSTSSAGRTSMPSTSSGVPHPGTGEVTILVVLSGIALVAGGWKLKNSV